MSETICSFRVCRRSDPNNVRRFAGADDVPNLPFMRQVIDETLRLYPSVAIILRMAMAPDTLCGREVRPKDSVIVPIYALQEAIIILATLLS